LREGRKREGLEGKDRGRLEGREIEKDYRKGEKEIYEREGGQRERER
jgi:hypothetical protein